MGRGCVEESGVFYVYVCRDYELVLGVGYAARGEEGDAGEEGEEEEWELYEGSVIYWIGSSSLFVLGGLEGGDGMS